MLIKIDGTSWKEFIGRHIQHSIFLSPAYLEVTASNFDLDISYYLWTEDSKEKIGFVVFEDAKIAKTPTSFHLTDFVDLTASQEELCTTLLAALKSISVIYTAVDLKLPINTIGMDDLAKDGFKVQTLSTYVKSLDILNYSRNINRLKKQGEEKNYHVCLSTDLHKSFTQIWKSNQAFFGFSGGEKYQSYFSELKTAGFAKFFDVYKATDYVGSLLVMEDKLKTTFYTYLISIPNKLVHAEAQTILYTYCMQYYKDLGFGYCDLCGANITSVANYKSKFKGDKANYIRVFYTSSNYIKIKRYVKSLGYQLISKLMRSRGND